MATARVLPDGSILRFTVAERLVHWVAGVSYVYLLLTGLAFWSPWLFWMAVMLGGGSFSRAVHPWIGLVFTAAVLKMYQIWRDDMRMTDQDRAWTQALGHYTRHEDDLMPPAGRFNAGQKGLFWLMYWGGIALLLSGVVMWFTDSIPRSLAFLRFVAILVHAIAALLTIGGFIIHVYMGTAVVRGGFASVIRGEVTEDWARMHHPLWLKQITGNAPPKR
jgi:formate dehydrogenase subunit gamma